MQTYIDTRIKEDQPLIDRLARDFLRNEDKRELEVALGRPLDSIQFRPAEYLYLNTIYPMPRNYRRRYMELFKYILTIDRWLARMRGLYNMVVELNTIVSESAYSMLKNELIHPSYVPWSVIEKGVPTYKDGKWGAPYTNFAELSPEQQMQYSMKNERPIITDERGWTRASYLSQFPILASLVAINQGLYLDAPEMRDAVWINSGMTKFPNAGSHARGGPMGIKEPDAATYPDRVNLAEGYKEITKHKESDLGKICQKLAESFLRVGGVAELQNMYNKLMQAFQATLATSPLTVHRTPAFFVTDIISGPNYGDNLKCPDGMMPQFIGYDGKGLTEEQAIMEWKGTKVISALVDPLKSTCAPMGEIKGMTAPMKSRKTKRKIGRK